MKFAKALLFIAAAFLLSSCGSSGSGGGTTSSASTSVQSVSLQGTLDTNYNGTGIANSTAYTYLENLIAGLIVESDGSAGLGARASSGDLEFAVYGSTGAAVNASSPMDCMTVFGNSCQLGSLIEQTDGKVVIGYLVNSTPKRIEFVRINTDGSFDSGFGHQGIVSVTSQTGSAEPFHILELPNGQLLAEAEVTNTNTQGFSPAILRMNSDGSLDSTFGSGGIAIATLVYHSYSMTFDPSTGDIYLGGTDSNIPGADLVEHLSPTGVEDTAFGTAGLATVGSQAVSRNDIAFDTLTNKIVVMSNGTGNTTDLRIVRLGLNGQLDSSFGIAGVFQQTLATLPNTFTSTKVKMEPGSGKILVLGNIQSSVIPFAPPTSTFVLARLTSAGALDTSFATNGILQGPANTYLNMSAMEFTPDNELYLGGVTAQYAQSCFITGLPGPCPLYSYTESTDDAAIVKVK